jgi:hypothetical protein
MAGTAAFFTFNNQSFGSSFSLDALQVRPADRLLIIYRQPANHERTLHEIKADFYTE